MYHLTSAPGTQGNQIYEGRERCNDFSIGIELEGTEHIEYTDRQYQQLAAVIRTLLKLILSYRRNALRGIATLRLDEKPIPAHLLTGKDCSGLLK